MVVHCAYDGPHLPRGADLHESLWPFYEALR